MDAIKFLWYPIWISILISWLWVGYYFSIVLPENQKINNELRQREITFKEQQAQRDALQIEKAQNEKTEKETLQSEKEQEKKVEEVKLEEDRNRLQLEKNIEKCSEYWAQILKTEKIEWTSNFQENHYNSTLSRCYVKIESIAVDPQWELRSNLVRIYDALELKMVWSFAVNNSPYKLISCLLTYPDRNHKECKDRREFNNLAKLYLEE